jgi:hypothetical protein
MRSLTILVLLTGSLRFCGCQTLKVLDTLAAGEALSTETVVAGLKEALTVGTRAAVAETSRKGGFAKHASRRITTPEELEKVASALRKIGLGTFVDDFEAKMNLAAERASAEAGAVFLATLKRMTFADAMGILQGDQTAATRYFRERTEDELRRRYAPHIRSQLDKVGAIAACRKMLTRYNRIPWVKKVHVNPERHVTDRALDGLFGVLAEEESKIRSDPAARTTELLRRVFAAQ